MKLKSLLLGSVAAAGLSTGAFAADPKGSVLTSLDVCDLLGISGLTIASDTNCLSITGNVSYELRWGDYKGTTNSVLTPAGKRAFNLTPIGVTYSPVLATPPYNEGSTQESFFVLDNDGPAGTEMDWESRTRAWLQFVAAAESDFGTAKAVIKFDYNDRIEVQNEVQTNNTATGGSTNTLRIEDAYVSIGDSTIIMAGQKGTIFKQGNDTPLNFLGLFNSEQVGSGVNTPVTNAYDANPTHVIQIVSDLGNGVSVGAGLENLNGVQWNTNAANLNRTADDGVFTGYIQYAGQGITAHASVIGGGFMDGTVEDWAFHAGLTGTFDMFKFVGAVAADDNGYWNALGSASATFDMFTLAISGEFVDISAAAGNEAMGFGGSIGAKINKDIALNAGFRWFDSNTTAANTETWQAALQLVATVTETVKLTGEIGAYSSNQASWAANPTILYGKGELAWNPGGDFTSSIGGEVTSVGGYKATFKAAKSFK